MSAKTYRQTPVAVEAIRFEKPYWKVKEFCPDITFYKGGSYGTLVRLAGLPTPEGVVKIELGDFIIKGIDGGYYPCKPDAFKQDYEEVDG